MTRRFIEVANVQPIISLFPYGLVHGHSNFSLRKKTHLTQIERVGITIATESKLWNEEGDILVAPAVLFFFFT